MANKKMGVVTSLYCFFLFRLNFNARDEFLVCFPDAHFLIMIAQNKEIPFVPPIKVTMIPQKLSRPAGHNKEYDYRPERQKKISSSSFDSFRSDEFFSWLTRIPSSVNAAQETRLSRLCRKYVQWPREGEKEIRDYDCRAPKKKIRPWTWTNFV